MATVTEIKFDELPLGWLKEEAQKGAEVCEKLQRLLRPKKLPADLKIVEVKLGPNLVELRIEGPPGWMMREAEKDARIHKKLRKLLGIEKRN